MMLSSCTLKINMTIAMNLLRKYFYIPFEQNRKKSIFSLLSQEYTKLTNIILPLYMISKVDLKEFTFMSNQVKKGKRDWPPAKPKEPAYKAPNDVI